MLGVVSSAYAQRSAISGLVTDQTGAVVPGAQVTLSNDRTGVVQGGVSNDSGIYSLPFVAPGRYSLIVEASGFKRSEQSGIVVETGQALAIGVRLDVGEVAETVTVDGSGLRVNTVDASVSTLVDRTFVENMPMNGRSFQSLMTLAPGVTAVPSSGVGQSGGLSVNGQRTESNYFTVDGVSANTGAAASGAGSGAGFSGSLPGQTMLGTTQSLISVDALEEFRTTTSTYSAEFGRTPGGQFSIRTRSGTNDWHGSLFNYLRNDALDANNWFNNVAGAPKQALRQNDFGGTFGGPLLIPGVYNGKNKTFFFGSYEGLRLRYPQPSQRYVVPSIRLRNAVSPEFRPTLDAFPLPDDPSQDEKGVAYFSSGYSAPSSLNATSIRVDHQINSNFQIFARYGANPSKQTTRGTNLALISSPKRTVDTFTLGATNILSPRFANDLRFNFTRNVATSDQHLDDFGGAKPYTIGDIQGMTDTDWYGFYFFLADRVSYAFTPTRSRQRQYNIVDGFTASLGRHALKFGVDYRRLENFQSVPSFYQWSWAFDESVMLQNNFDTVALYRYTTPVKPVYSNFSAYLQDEWKATSRLSLSLGLRWEVNPPPNDADGNNPYTINQIDDLTTTKLAPRGARLWNTRYLNLAPRVGVAYQLHDSRDYQTVLRTGAGVFYDTGNATASQGYTGIGSVYRYFTTGAFPATQQTLDSVPQPNVDPPYSVLVFGYDPHLKLPYTLQWNTAIEQSLGKRQSLTASYVGSAGRRLTLLRAYDLGAAGNPNFTPGAASSLHLIRNGASSNYHSLQVRFQRRLSRGLQALASHTWSHATDNATSNFQVTQLRKADSDYDVRHSFQAAITYETPSSYGGRLASSLLGHWAVDTRIMARSALPVDVNSGVSGVEGVGLPVTFHPNRVASEPLYVYDQSLPGGRQINPGAFVPATDAQGHNTEGDIGRNYARGFSAVQFDIALRREFPLTERFRLQFRAEAFNLANEPIFGSIYGSLNAGTDAVGRNRFGQAYQTLNSSLGGMNPLYQIGGPRSMQVSLKLLF